MLAPGNTKLGPSMYSFSIPAMHSCPGSTEACIAACYAKRGHYRWGSTRKAHERNWQRSLCDDFVAEIVAEIAAKRVRILRLHSSGDFYSAEYVRKWIAIAQQCPTVRMFGYTRSYRAARMQRSLLELSRLKNVELWLSADRDSGRPPSWASTKIAYMLVAGDTFVPTYADLVFRTGSRNTVAKYIAGRLVCPAEQGVVGKTGKTHITCSNCQLCYSGKPTPKQQLVTT